MTNTKIIDDLINECCATLNTACKQTNNEGIAETLNALDISPNDMNTVTNAMKEILSSTLNAIGFDETHNNSQAETENENTHNDTNLPNADDKSENESKQSLRDVLRNEYNLIKNTERAQAAKREELQQQKMKKFVIAVMNRLSDKNAHAYEFIDSADSIDDKYTVNIPPAVKLTLVFDYDFSSVFPVLADMIKKEGGFDVVTISFAHQNDETNDDCDESHWKYVVIMTL